MVKSIYKYARSVVPTVLLCGSIGWIYAFSLFSNNLVEALGISKTAVQFSFCLSIFFLGMGAAFGGKLVEKNIKLSAWLTAGLLFSGLVVANLAVYFKSAVLLYLGIGVLCGCAQGIGYVTPVKNMLLWMNKSKYKGVITAIPIICFGLGSTLCSLLFPLFNDLVGFKNIFWLYAVTYLIPCCFSAYLIDKPKYIKAKMKKENQQFSYMKYFKDKFFIQSWMFMFLNISMGLVLIGSCVNILKDINLPSDKIVLVMALCGIFNGAGRLVFPAISDLLRKRIYIWIAILLIEIGILAPVISYYPFILLSIIICNACYGAGFSTLPSILSDNYGNKELSFIHGFCLSAWGIASIAAFICTTFILNSANSYNALIPILICGYVANLINVFFINKKHCIN